MVKLVVGLTGGVSSGKSTVSRMLRALGVPIIDADAISRALVTPETPAWRAIVQHFGPRCLNADQTLNRPALRQQIFTTPEDKQWLEALLHPLIFQGCLEALATLPSALPYAVLEIPLLVESKLAYPIDALWVVDCTPAQQKARLMSRDQVSATLADAMLSSQVTREERLKKAQAIIPNEGSLEALQAYVLHLHQNTLQRVAER